MKIKEVDAEGPPWNPKHEGIPPTWTHKGDGGNAHVWTDGIHAIKRLRPNASKEPVARFAREAQLLAAMAGESELAIVPIVEVRKRAGEIEIVMELLEGNLAEVIGEFAGQPEKAANALLPIVETLARLAVRQRPVHHRDIKPENLLYWQRDGKIELALSDFGCAYLAEDERLTSTHRAIGAWAYRPPEYSVGRVENVDEKGDVFSLGKVFWAMVNGQRHVVFPGPVWFQEEFDLTRQFPTVPKIHHAMVLIAQTCNIRPEKRPTLAQLVENLRHLILPATGKPSLNDDELTSAMLRKEAQREIEYQQRRAFAAQFVFAIHADFLQAIDRLHNDLPQSALFREWFNETQKCGQSQQALVNQVAEHESDAPVSNVFFQKTLLNTRFFPGSGTTPIRFVARIEDLTCRAAASELTIFGNAEGTRADSRYSDGDTVSEPYQSNLVIEFLRKAAMQLP
ncbi:Serine/threonine protein kinase [Azotobacter beijerinckii]|uniref:Serine/threonine protein kinase n=1 Tax=Azotobacter beijerinckii TaxID=170623 RepID=A0A1H7A844_9GAMM|nr:protein kinase [Azotobacter beijerinckii]SEJ57215.1 Serine/threonine protein kinase [Azotobacter beijerinckii]